MPEQPEPDLEELFSRAARQLRHRWADVLGPWELSPHHARALRVVCRHGRLRLNELAEHLRVAPRSVTDVVDALERRGLVNRVPDPGDRRAANVEPTDSGRRTLAEIDAAKRADTTEFFTRLSEPQRTQLAKLLAKLV